MFEEFVNKKLSQSAEKIAESKVLPLTEKIDDLTSGIEIITDVVSTIPKMVDEKISTVKNEIKVIKGEKGDKGDKGDNGNNGTNGMDGIDGLDGSPDTPKDIVKKLESLKDNSRLDKSAIKGLDFATQSDIDRAISILDQRTQYLINKQSGSTTTTLPFTAITGNPFEVAYFDASGNGTSDAQFWRDPTNGYNTGLETRVDADISVYLRTDYDGSIYGVPAIFVGYNNSDIGLTTGLLSGGTLGIEASQLVFSDGVSIVSHSVDALNATTTYTDGDITTQFAATDVAMNMTYTKTSTNVTQGSSFGATHGQMFRLDNDFTVNEKYLRFDEQLAELYMRKSGGRRYGSVYMEPDNIIIGDPTGQASGLFWRTDMVTSTIEGAGLFGSVISSGFTFTGSGLDDITDTTGRFYSVADVTFTITIDTEGTPDTFSWVDDKGNSGSSTVTTTPQTLSYGASIAWAADTGHTSGDSWEITMHARATDMIKMEGVSGFMSFGDVDDGVTGTKLYLDVVGETANVITDGYFNVKNTNGDRIIATRDTDKLVSMGDCDDVGNETKITISDASQSIKLLGGIYERITDIAIDTDYTVLDGDRNIIPWPDSTTVTVTLPASPSDGRVISITDGRGAISPTHQILVDGNGKSINGSSADTLVLTYESKTYKFSAVLDEWNIY